MLELSHLGGLLGRNLPCALRAHSVHLPVTILVAYFLSVDLLTCFILCAGASWALLHGLDSALITMLWYLAQPVSSWFQSDRIVPLLISAYAYLQIFTLPLSPALWPHCLWTPLHHRMVTSMCGGAFFCVGDLLMLAAAFLLFLLLLSGSLPVCLQ
jgi:hypothetical protein